MMLMFIGVVIGVIGVITGEAVLTAIAAAVLVLSTVCD